MGTILWELTIQVRQRAREAPILQYLDASTWEPSIVRRLLQSGLRNGKSQDLPHQYNSPRPAVRFSSFLHNEHLCEQPRHAVHDCAVPARRHRQTCPYSPLLLLPSAKPTFDE